MKGAGRDGGREWGGNDGKDPIMPESIDCRRRHGCNAGYRSSCLYGAYISFVLSENQKNRERAGG